MDDAAGEKSYNVSTPLISVTVSKKDGAILFADATGKKLFQDYDRSLTPVEVNGEKTYHSELFSNLWDSTEAFFGLGQHQAGVWNYHGETVDISEANTNISVPMFLSSNGYGIFWNNTSRSRFNNRFPHELYLSSEVADTVDYYFMYGPEFDNIIAAYRDMTGAGADVRQMGVRILAVQEQVRIAGRSAGRRAQISRAAYSGR